MAAPNRWIPSTLCYIESNHQYLMMHRNKQDQDIHKGKWNGLGGKLLPGEPPIDGVKREVLEESNLRIQTPQLRGILTFPHFKPGEDWLVFLYTCQDFLGDLSENHEGSLSWISKTEILDYPLWEGDRYFLKWLMDNRPFFTATFIYENKILIDHQVSWQ